MRRALTIGVFFIAAGAAGAQPAAGPTRVQLALMPLPLASYGSAAASLPVASTSGSKSNKVDADEDDPAMSVTKLARLGRVAGYDLAFTDLTKASRPGQLIAVDSEIDVFRTAAGAAGYAELELSKFRRLEGKNLDGVMFDRVSYFPVPGVAGARGAHFRVRIGSIVAWETGVEFHAGVLVGSSSLVRTDNRDVRTEARRVGAALRQRIRGVLAGRVHDKPLPKPLPKLGGLGPPPGGPSLSRMAIRPIDLNRQPKPTRQRYVRDSNLVAKYTREFKSVTFGTSLLASLKVDVELQPTERDAEISLGTLKSLFSGARGRKLLREELSSGNPKNVRLDNVSLTKFTAGDEAFAYRANYTVVGAHVHIQAVICVVRRGPVVERMTLVSRPPTERVARVDIVRIARTAAARIDLELHH